MEEDNNQIEQPISTTETEKAVKPKKKNTGCMVTIGLFSLFLFIVVLAIVTAPSPSIYGNWVLIKIGDTSTDPIIIMQLNKDGTCENSFYSTEDNKINRYENKFKEEDQNIVFYEETSEKTLTYAYTVDSSNLTLSINGSDFVYARSDKDFDELENEQDALVKSDSGKTSTSNSSTNTTTQSTAEDTQASLEPVTLSAGNYTVGTDIPAGKYNIIAESGRGNIFGPGINEIMGAAQGDDYDDKYVQTYNNILLVKGNTMELKGTLVVTLDPVK